MANITIRDLPEATTIQDDDLIVVNDSAVDKRMTKDSLRGDLEVWISKYTTDQLSTATSLRAGNKVRTPGYYAEGDGGGNDFIVEAKDGSTEDGGSIIFIAGTSLQAKGLFDGSVNPKKFGAKGDGVADDTVSLETALNFTGPKVLPKGNYRIARQIDVATSDDFILNSQDARIFLDSPGHIEKMLQVTTTGSKVLVTGALELDGQNKTNGGIHFTGSAPYRPLTILDIYVKNCNRKDEVLDYPASGIYVVGGYSSATLSRFKVENIWVSEGGHTEFVHGAHGLTVTRNSISDDIRLISVTDFEIDKVYTLDALFNQRDQDGIRIFQSYNSANVDATNEINNGYCVINKGRIKNALGRAIKLQSEGALVSDMKIVRDSSIVGAPVATRVNNEDIDFQVSTGSVENIEFWYQDNFPQDCVYFHATFSGTRRIAPLASVRNIRIFTYGTNSINSVVALTVDKNMPGNGRIKVAISEVTVHGSLVDINHVVETRNEPDATFTGAVVHISLRDIFLRCAGSIAYRDDAINTNGFIVTGYDIINAKPLNVKLASGTTPVTGITSLLHGINSRVEV